MPAGTLHITGPGQPLIAEFQGPCDFLHFHVSSDYLRECQEAARSTLAEPIPDLNDLIVRDPLAELLGSTLIESGSPGDSVYVESVGQTLVMHVARLEPPRHTVSALPKWRLKRVQEYVAHAPRRTHQSRRPCQGGRTFAHAFRGAIPSSDRIPSARLRAATADRMRQGHSLDHGHAACRSSSCRRVSSSSALFDRLQATDGRNSGALEESQSRVRRLRNPRRLRNRPAISGSIISSSIGRTGVG